MKIGIISIGSLPEEERKFLLSLEDKGKSIPVYYRDGEENVFFVQDFELKDNETFEKTAPNSLYRGGALLSLKTDEGLVVLADERYNWLRLIGGIADFDEGSDLIKTAVREGIIEELAVVSMDKKTRFVPKGISVDTLEIANWEFSVEKIEEIGEIEVLDYSFNNDNRAFEAVIQWSVPGKLMVLHSESWFSGGISGITPQVLDSEGEKIGYYSGQQGFIDERNLGFHPTLLRILNPNSDL